MRNGSVCRSVNGFAQLNARWPNTSGISPPASLGPWNPKYESPPVLRPAPDVTTTTTTTTSPSVLPYLPGGALWLLMLFCGAVLVLPCGGSKLGSVVVMVVIVMVMVRCVTEMAYCLMVCCGDGVTLGKECYVIAPIFCYCPSVVLSP